MKVASDLVIGYAILSAVRENLMNLNYEYFNEFSSKLNQLIKEKGYSDLSYSDIYDEIHILSRYMDLEHTFMDNRQMNIKIKDNIINELEEKLNIYYKNITPDWLLEKMEEIKANK
jgi:hypothetical protein